MIWPETEPLENVHVNLSMFVNSLPKVEKKIKLFCSVCCQLVIFIQYSKTKLLVSINQYARKIDWFHTSINALNFSTET